MAKSPIFLSILLAGTVVAVAFGFATHVTGRNEAPPGAGDGASGGLSEADTLDATIDRTARFLDPPPGGSESDEDGAAGGGAEPRPAPPEPVLSKGGPLEELGWTYAWSTINRDTPTDSFVLLRQPGPPVEELSFWVRDARVRSREHGLDFIVVSADVERFVYFLPEDPLHQFELRRPRSDFFSAGRQASGRAAVGE